MADISLKSLVPSVFVDRITLENKPMELRESNPHVDSLREPNSYVDPLTGKIKREETRANLLKKSQEPNPLIVKIDFVMKEKFESDIVSSWFDLKNNRELLKYFKVKIIQSLDEDFTSKLLQAKSLLEVEAPNTVVSRDSLVGFNLLTKNTTDYYMTIKENDVREYDIPFSETFVLKNSNPQHLAYFCACYLDLDDLMKDYGLDGVSENFRMLQGKVNAELIINNYELMSDTFIFVNEHNEIWDGQVTKIETNREIKDGERVITTEKDVKWIAGDGKDKNNIQYLESKMIPNTKIQDFRHANELERELLNFSIIDNNLINQVNGQIKMPTSNEIVVDINKSKSYFSDFHMTRDKNGRTRFFFGIDLLNIAKDYTIFGKLYKDRNSELMNQIKVRYMKLKRYRVKNSVIRNDLGIAVFDENDSYDLIATSGEKEVFDFIVGRIQNGTVREVVLDLESGVRFFTGIDKNMEKVTFGLYQYVVEVELEDGTLDFLKDRINLLLNSYEIFKQYCNDGEVSGNYDAMSDRFTQDFIDRQENIYKDFPEESPWRKIISSYLSLLELLIDNFDTKKYSNSLLIYTHPRSGSMVGLLLVKKLVENLLIKLSSIIEIKSSKTTRDKISNSNTVHDSQIKNRITNPVRTIKLEKAFESIFDSDLPKNIGYDYLSSNEFEREINEDGLTVVTKVNFEERTNKETLKYYKDIDTNINLKSNFRDITIDDKMINNKYKYLTPSIIDLKSNKINLLDKGAGLFDSKSYEKVATFAMSFNMLKQSPRTPVPAVSLSSFSQLTNHDQSVKFGLSNIAFTKGIAISFSGSNTITNFVKTKDIMGDASLFQTDNKVKEQIGNSGAKTNKESVNSINPNSIFMSLMQPETTKGMNNNFAAANLNSIKNSTSIKNDVNVFNLNNKNNVVDLSKITQSNAKFSLLNSQGDLRSIMVKNLPNQIKSIMLAGVDSSATKFNWFGENINILADSKKNLGFLVNYYLINEVQVFDGYEKTTRTNTTQNHMREEKWIELTPEVFSRSINRNLLCRMKPYNNKQFGVERPQGIDLPTYNEYFILSPIEKFLDKVGIVIPINMKKDRIQSILNVSEKYIIKERQYSTSLISAERIMDVNKIQPKDLSLKTISKENKNMFAISNNVNNLIKGIK